MRKFAQKTVVTLLTAAILISMMPFSITALADDPVEGAASSTFEPWIHGYRFVDVLNFDPATDPYAGELRALIPIQERNEPFAATQNNPNLSPDVQLYSISTGNYRSTDVSNAPYNGNMAYDDFSYGVYKFWQYTDYVGAGGRPTTPRDELGTGEYGCVALPIPAAINAAHKNGALALGEYFFPRAGQFINEWLYKDKNGNFPYGQKMIDIMNYYGFDGYFLNNESSFDGSLTPVFKEMLVWMRSKGCYIQIYDGITDGGDGSSYQNYFTAVNSPWVQDPVYGRVSDSIFLNYWNTGNMQGSVDHALSLGLKPREAVFYGVEGGIWTYGPLISHLPSHRDETGNARLSYAIWGSDFFREAYNTGGNLRYTMPYQWQSEVRERMYFGSRSENVRNYTKTTSKGSQVGVSTSQFEGFSAYIAERSVINGTVFATNFNNGHGMQYFKNGSASRDVEWANLAIQDILPTWQWWIDGDGGLDMDWDYGPKHTRIVSGQSNPVPFAYEQKGAYDGGSSLVVFGNLNATTFVNLYKTELNIVDDSTLSLTYYKPDSDASSMRLGLKLLDGTDGIKEEYITIPDAGASTKNTGANGWKTVTLPLAALSGETIMAVGLEFSPGEEAVNDYQVNLGQFKVLDGGDYTPAKPEGFAITNIFDGTGEVKVAWEPEEYGGVIQYNIYAEYSDGSERFVGGVYSDCFYIKTLENRGNIVSLNLRAVGPDGSESAPSKAAFNHTDVVSDIRTISGNNKLIVGWNEPDANFDSVEVTLDYWYAQTPKPSVTVTVPKGEGKTELPVPLEDGSRYVLTLRIVSGGVKGEPANFFGRLTDTYSEPFNGNVRLNAAGNRLIVSTPWASDWRTMAVSVNGAPPITYTRGGSMPDNIAASNVQSVTVTVTDRFSNVSAPVTFLFASGVPIDPEEEICDLDIPDPVLRAAVKSQIGSTYGDLLYYNGGLNLAGLNVADLTGLKLIPGLSALDISGTKAVDLSEIYKLQALTTFKAARIPVTSFELPAMPASLKKIDLSGNTGLTVLDLKDAAADVDLNLSGCVNVEKLYLTGTKLSTFDISEFTKLVYFQGDSSDLETLAYADAYAYTDIHLFDIRGSKFDLSAGTPERALVEAIEVVTEGKEDVVGYVSTISNLALGKTPIASMTNMSNAARTFDGAMQFFITGSPAPRYVTVELDAPSPLTGWKLYNYPELASYRIADYQLEGSMDGEVWYPLGAPVVNGVADPEYTMNFDAPITALYVKFTVTNVGSVGLMREVEVYGYETVIYEAGAKYADQRPRAILEALPESVIIPAHAETRIMDYFERTYTEAVTVRGTKFAGLAGADWVAAGYDIAAQIAVPEKVYVEIYDTGGNLVNEQEEGPEAVVDTTVNVAAGAAILGRSGQYMGEEAHLMFDGRLNTKWCTDGQTGWSVFYLPEAVSVGQWVTHHAQAGGEAANMNTKDFELQILNTDAVGMSEDAFIAAIGFNVMDSRMSNNANWITIAGVNGNTGAVTTVDVESAGKARVYRIRVISSIQGALYAAIRIYELELYAADTTPRDYDGKFAPDAAGTYTVNFIKGKNTLGTMNAIAVDKRALQKAIADFEALDPNDYSIATWNTAQAAYDAAVAVLEKQDATQAEADKAAAALEAAIDGLVRRATELKITGPVSVTVKKGKTAPLGFTYNGGDENIRFISSNPSVVTVTNDGVVKGVKTGMAIITAYTVDGSNLYSYTVVNVIA